MSIKWEGRNDSKRLHQDAQDQEAQEAMRLLFTGADNVICECCGIVDPCCTNGMCPECRQGIEIG